MSRAQQDQFVDDDEEEVCPLCVEEFDLSDKNFRPCPCGYQVRVFPKAATTSFRVGLPPLTLLHLDMSILLQQHQDNDEWAMSRLSKTL